MKTLTIFAVIFLTFPAQAEDKKFDWNNENTWGAHPPSEEEMDRSPPNQKPKQKDKPVWGYDALEPSQFSWEDEESWGAHPPSEEEMDELKPASAKGKAGKMVRRRDGRCLNPNKSANDCHFCTDSTRSFVACMQEKGPVSRRINLGKPVRKKESPQGDPRANPFSKDSSSDPAPAGEKVDPAG